MRLPAAISMLALAASAGGQVVIDMPAPSGIPAALSAGEPTPAVGEVALRRYAWGRTGPLYRSGPGPWWGYPYPRYGYYYSWGWSYPWYGYCVWPGGYWGFGTWGCRF